MKKLKQVNLSFFLLISIILSSCAVQKPLEKPNIDKLAYQKLETFGSEREFERYIRSIHKVRDYRDELDRIERERRCGGECKKITITGSRLARPRTSITNNQVAGVDEGDIVKQKGDYLLILRRGKIYSVAIKDNNNNALIPTSQIDVTPPGWKFSSWYDEMLVSDNKVLVLGFSYDLDSSIVLRFEISNKGILSYQDGYLFSSSDYYSSENYASRIYDGKYITYMPTPLTSYGYRYSDDGSAKYTFPKKARVEGNDEKDLRWKDLVTFDDITKPLQSILDPTLHSVLTCDPLSDNFTCDVKSVVGSDKAIFYVDKDSIYLWVQGWDESLLFDIAFDRSTLLYLMFDEELKYLEYLNALVFKVPFQDGDITAIKVPGEPRNQFSFYSNGDALYMNLIDQVSQGGRLHSSLYKLPFTYFTVDGLNEAQKVAELPHTYDEVNNRFNRGFLVTGSASNLFWSKGADPLKEDFDIILQKIDGQFQRVVALEHSADRIEPLGSSMFIAGLDVEGNYNVSILSLEQNGDVIAKQTFEDILEEESRSHAFNHREINGITYIGITSFNKGDAYVQENKFVFDWNDNLASDILFFGLDKQGDVSKSGVLKNELRNVPDNDECDFSCYDWYGNSRPFFIGDRIFGLSGDELIEAKIVNAKVKELNRVNIKEVE
ncbi:beta-propeller domain-containing protein [Pleionea litopenaei]|uniref:Beta-propeller domain-containing protein n=1 Tax=Pleionea litopenaei TaxID=3070815 RepID=A0AA51X7Y8_9GAMM|nr:beta-propeller domain-containing protein [Pleionea sp. HL-JVS1]WMS88822.1 beta-propeller domain-containing protein [Pleionea sp. HL-JVS1]